MPVTIHPYDPARLQPSHNSTILAHAGMSASELPFGSAFGVLRRGMTQEEVFKMQATGRALGLAILALLTAASSDAPANRGDRTPTEKAAVDAKRPAKNTFHFETVGLYCSLPTDPPPTDPRLYDFLKACGYNYLEFCEAGFRSRPDLLPGYYKRMSRAIDTAHQRGFRVGILLLAGMEQWKGPDETGSAGVFSPLDKPKLQERLTHLRQEAQHLRNADRFVFLPGDPGGDPNGRSTVEDCFEFSRQVHQIVRQEAPNATFMVNLWGIAEWEGFPSPRSLRFWQQEVKLSRAVAAAPDFLGPDCGAAFPLHNYYRSLTLACYTEAGLKPEPYPTAKEIRTLRARGVKPLLGWPYFLVDEADDGYITPNNADSRGQSSAETRYIRALVDRGRALGLDGLVANAIYPKDEALNIYAFGQMCRSADLTPGQLIDRFAGLVADGGTRVALGQVLRTIENHSNWQISLPAWARLKNFDVPNGTSASAALDLLAQVRPCVHPAIPLPEPPALYLGRLKKRLEAIAAGKIGGVTPIIKSITRP
jgi:hypothetical protein